MSNVNHSVRQTCTLMRPTYLTTSGLIRFCLKTGLLSNRGGAATVVDTLSPLVASRVSFEHICTQDTPIFNTYQTQAHLINLHCTYKCRQHVMIDGCGSVVELVLQGSGDGCSADRLGRSQRRLLRIQDCWMRGRCTTRRCASCGGRVRGGWRGTSLTQGRGFTLWVCCQAEGK